MVKIREGFSNRYWLDDDKPWDVNFYITDKGYMYQQDERGTKRISEEEYISAIEYHHNA